MTATNDITAEELGVRALPPGATPAQRAHAEAVWRPSDVDQPCRCSSADTGDCEHGAYLCDNEEIEDGCPGRYVHADRRPGSMLAVTAWQDVYVCPTCEASYERSVQLPDIPWGEQETVPFGSSGETTTSTRVYPGVRHPNFHEIPQGTPEHPEGDGTCRGCGAYAFSGFLCDQCRANGWTDYYGIVEHDDDAANQEWDQDTE